MISKFLLLFSVACFAECQFVSGLGYHELIGIPKAAALRQSEGSLLRIVGGSKVPESAAVPYQAGILVTLTLGATSVCGGALLSSTRVATAAHCWWDGRSQAQRLTVVLGSLNLFSGGTRRTSTDVRVHPTWNTEDITHDIAVVGITRVDFSNNIQAIPLPKMAEVNQNFVGLAAKASGYGKTSDVSAPGNSLHSVNLKIISNAECQKSFAVSLHGSHLCTSGHGEVGTCDGDSGGPLTVVRNMERILVGIVSFGLGDGCQSGYPSVYTRVTAFLNWIQAQM